MKIGAWEVLEEVGRGGAGIVHRARGPGGQEAAVKFLRRQETPERRARFEREARLLASFTATQGVVPLLDAGESPQGPYIVMPFLTGGTLRDRLRRGRMAIEATVELALGLAHGLANAHERGIVHRDLKPENVLFGIDGRPLLSDFGLAKHFDRSIEGGELSASISRVGGFRGTIGYVPPEQLRDARDAGARADVFALGAVLYECLAGAPAFDAPTFVELLVKIEAGDFVPLRSARPETPAWLASVVERSLALDPGSRFEDGRAVERALLDGRPKVETRGHASRGILVPVLVAVLAAAVATAIFASVSGLGGSTSGESSQAALPKPSTVPRPAGKPTERARELALPEILRPLARSAHARLAAVWGNPDWRTTSMVADVAVSADGKLALSSGLEPWLTVWELPSGRQRRCIRVESQTHAVALAPSGELGFAGSDDGLIRVVELATGRVIRELRGHESWIWEIAVSPDGKRLVSGSSDGTIRTWDLSSGEAHVIEGLDPVRPYTLAVSPDRRKALARMTGGLLRLCDLGLGTTGPVVDAPLPTNGVPSFAPDGRRVAVPSENAIEILDLGVLPGEASSTRVRLRGHEAPVQRAIFTPDGKRLVSASRDGTLRLWDAGSGSEIRSLGGHRSWVTALAILGSGQQALTGSNDQTLRLWDLESGRELSGIARAGRTTALAVSHDGKRAASGGWYGDVSVRDAEGNEVAILPGEGQVGALALSADGSLALAAWGPRIVLWNVGRRTQLATLGVRGAVGALAFAPGDELAASGDASGTITIWDLARHEAVRSFPAHGGAVLSLRWLDATRIVSGGADGVLAVFDAASGTKHEELARAAGGTYVRWDSSADAKHAVALASLEDLKPVELWELGSGARASTLGTEGGTLATALAPDASIVATAIFDGTVILWDARSRVPIDRIPVGAAGDTPVQLAFLPDGRSLLVGTARGLVLRFELVP